MLARLLPRFSPFDKLDWPTLLSLSHHCRVLTIPKGRSLASKGRGRYYLVHGSVGLSGRDRVKIVREGQTDQLCTLGVIVHGTEQARYPLDTGPYSRLATRRVCQLLWIDTEPVAFLLDGVDCQAVRPLFQAENGWMNRFLGGHLLASVSPPGLQAIIRAMSTRNVVNHEQVIKQGEVGNIFYVISSGTAEVIQSGPVAALGPGDFFGEDALISTMRRNADVVMSSDGELKCISAEAFHGLLANKVVKPARLEGSAVRLDVSLAGRCKEQDIDDAITHIPICHLRNGLNRLNVSAHYVVTGDTMPECRLATFILLHHGFNANCCIPGEQHQAGTVRSFAQLLNA
ncbi:MAG: cyclic nucleotide-binding domain-containing protein [Pseudomonadales bacterium]|nr:cyclic nucleotide-binding domain-containing protein [Pseudomonadales bacterium]